MHTYVLVHGGGHGGWCYDKVTRRLQALPFAVRCAPCEGAREKSMARTVVKAARAYPHALVDA